MPIIKPISDLRNNFNQISETCHEGGQPVFITKNGQGDLVVMSIALYEEQQSLIKLYEKLSMAQAQSVAKVPRISHEDLVVKMRKMLDE